MFSSRRLLIKPTFDLLKIPKPKCYSSSSPPKKLDAVSESNIKKYIESTHVEKKAGSSWYSVKDLLTNLKDKVLGNHELKNQIISEISTAESNIKACDVEQETVTPFSELVSEYPSVEKVNTSDIMEGISKTVCENSASLDIKMCKKTKNAEICEAKRLVHEFKTMKKENSKNEGENSASLVEENYLRPLSKIVVDSLNEKTTSKSVYTCLKEEDSFKDLDFPRENSRIPEISNISETLKVPEIVELDKGDKIPVDGAKSQNLVSFSSQFLSEKSKKTLDEDGLDIFNSKESVYNQAGVVENDKDDLPLPNGFLDFSYDKSGAHVGKGIKVMSLIDCIKGLSVRQMDKSQEKFATRKTNQVYDKANLHVSKKTHAMGKDYQFSYKNSIRLGQSQTEVHNSEKKVKQCTLQNPVLSKESEKTKGIEGKRSKIQLKVNHENNNRTENSQDITSSLENKRINSSIPDLIDDPDIPTAVLKHPTRMVKVETLTNKTSLRELKKALHFCGYAVTFICMGSSSSAAYVEFKTEDAKERAIAAHSIQVLGDKLFMSRIDMPRTTVVRISILNGSRIDLGKYRAICCSFGQVISVKQRMNEIVDVEFGFDEWTNMVKILNKLNGLEKYGSRWVAQPAPIFPPQILKILWNDSDGRQHLKDVMSGLLQKLEKNSACKAKLTNLTSKYHGEDVNLS